MRRRSAAILCALVATLTAASAGAQAPLTFGRFDFNFSNPGARSLAFGGAFAALADDATAAFANPAGLVQLARPELSFETRLWNRTPSFLAGGRFEGEPTGIGLDTHDGVIYGHDHNRSLAPSFAAAVFPRGRWAFALYGHRLAQFEIASESQGFFFGDAFEVDRFPATRERVDLDILAAGAAVAFRVNDRLSLGLDIVYSRTSLDTTSEAFLPDAEDEVFGVFGPSSFLPARRLGRSRIVIDGSDVTFNAGLLWSATPRLTVALIYRQGPKASGSDQLTLAAQGEIPAFDQSLPTEFQAPDVAGAGLAYHSGDGRLTLAGEVDRVGYAGLVTVRNTETVVVFGRDYLDAWEYHLGAELALLQLQPVVAVRLGGWVETKEADGRGNRNHLTGGVGVAGKVFQLDFAGDFSREADILSLSLIYSF